ncbi:MAG: M48 family metallopeptidase [Clostridia bacterium]|nr:M48 family metallopeptidase [Clostridia bacterium]
MIKRIKLLDREIEYDLQRKRVKNINLRIKPDKSITVSANPRVPENRIERFIIEKQEFILRALEKYGKMQKSLPKPKQYIDGETIKVFGKDFTLKVFLAKKNYVEKEEPFINLYVKDENDFSLKKKVLDKWLYKQVEEAVLKICEKVYPLFKKYCDDFPMIKFRKMTSRWGSCNFVRKILTFNYALINAPIECVEYVVYHEFTHFIQPNHSKKFYLALSNFLPEYKERKKKLQKISIIL